MSVPPESPARDPQVERIHAALPQTQCTRCGYPDCRGYAVAIAQGEAAINRCPPGGAEGIARLAALTGQPVVPLDPQHGGEGPRQLAVIDENWCIGCTLCIKACPVDCIIGASKWMHTIIDDQCTGCELCVPACPVDCISMQPVTGEQTGWAAWSQEQAADALQRYEARNARRLRERQENDARLAARAAARLAQLQALGPAIDDDAVAAKQAVIDAALARAGAPKKEPGR